MYGSVGHETKYQLKCPNLFTPYISRCQVVAKFCRDYKSHTVPARSDCIFFITHPEGACGWACTNLPRVRAATAIT